MFLWLLLKRLFEECLPNMCFAKKFVKHVFGGFFVKHVFRDFFAKHTCIFWVDFFVKHMFLGDFS